MPPKTKTEKKQANKVIEDATFGLKNKNKSKQVQKYVQVVKNQVLTGNQSQAKVIQQQFEEKQRKKQEEEEKALMASLFKSVNTAKPGKEIEEVEEDPKNKVCEFFKQGLCQKGKKCKFSHDTKKNEIIDIYTDQRDQLFNKEEQQEEENMEQWDEQKLLTVVNQNQQKYKNQNPTQIICKFFLNAVEQGKYGWKWVCPNGMNCIYRHCLPPGYVLKKQVQKKQDDDEEKVLLEEQLEKERSALSADKGTPVTLQRFLEWKEKKRKQREEEQEQKRKEEIKKAQSKGYSVMTGRNLFQYDPTLFEDDDDALDDEVYLDRNDEDDEDETQENQKIKQIQANNDDEDEDTEQLENWEKSQNVKINSDVFLD